MKRAVVFSLIVLAILLTGCTSSRAITNRLPFAEYLVGDWRVVTFTKMMVEEGDDRVLEHNTIPKLISYRITYRADHTVEDRNDGGLWNGEWDVQNNQGGLGGEGFVAGGYLVTNWKYKGEEANAYNVEETAIIIDADRMVLTSVVRRLSVDLDIPQYWIDTRFLVRL